MLLILNPKFKAKISILMECSKSRRTLASQTLADSLSFLRLTLVLSYQAMV
jgi:hypothetical protein